MDMTYRGHIKNGQITLDEPAKLPEGAEVSVELADASEPRVAVWDALLKLAGTVKGLPVDAAENHDRYLYGAAGKK